MTVLNDADSIFYRVGQLGGGAASKVYAGAVQAWPAIPTYRDIILGTPGIVGYWRLDEPDGSVRPFDETGNNNTNRWDRANECLFNQPGAVVNSPAIKIGYQSCVVIEGPLFAAMDDSLRPLPAEYEIMAREAAAEPFAMRVLDLADGPFTLEAWVIRHTAESAYRCILSKGAGAYTLWLNPDGSPAMHASAVGEICRSSVPISVEGWHHIVGTKNGPDSHMYVNGVDVTTPIGNHVMRDNAGQWLFLASENTGGWPGSWLNGSLDEVAIYNQVLTPAQVLEHYQSRGV